MNSSKVHKNNFNQHIKDSRSHPKRYESDKNNVFRDKIKTDGISSLNNKDKWQIQQSSQYKHQYLVLVNNPDHKHQAYSIERIWKHGIEVFINYGKGP